MSGEAWFNRYRPQRFADLCGQEAIATTLRRAVLAGRVSSGYLFAGPRGTGKTSAARVLAKAVNCERPEDGEPCNSCARCVAATAGTAPDVIEVDAASNRGIDDIRQLTDRAAYLPSSAPWRVYIVDEVHELTAGAFDAFLKTLEEPPAHVIFILATTAHDRIPPTIASRCQQHWFQRLTIGAIEGRLLQVCRAEGVTGEKKALRELSTRAGGSLRDGIGLLEAVVTGAGVPLTLAGVEYVLGRSGRREAQQVVEAVLAGQLGECFRTIAAATDGGIGARALTDACVAWTTALLHASVGFALEGADVEELRRVAKDVDQRAVLALLRNLAEVSRGRDASTAGLELACAQTILGVK